MGGISLNILPLELIDVDNVISDTVKGKTESFEK